MIIDNIMKRAFIFSLDAFLAIILFIFIIFLIYTSSISFFGLNQQYFFTDDLLNTLSNVKINELDLGNYPQISAQVFDKKINNTDTVLIEQIVTFKLNDDPLDGSNKDNAKMFVDSIIIKIRDEKLKSAISIGDALPFYGDELDANVNNILARSRLVIAKK